MHTSSHGYLRRRSRSRNTEDSQKYQNPVSIILDVDGNIVDCCRHGEYLFGYRREELENQHISKLFPQLSTYVLLKEGRFNARLDYLCRCGYLFHTMDNHGRKSVSELRFVELTSHGTKRTIRLIVLPTSHQRAESDSVAL